MKRTLAIALVWLLAAGPALGVCTAPTGALYWGPITSFTGSGVECLETGAPAGTDVIVVPDSSVTRVDSDLTYTADGSALIVEYGGEFHMDVPTDGDGHALNMHVYDGQDTRPDAEGQVAVYTEPGSLFVGQGGYATRYAETPALLATSSHALGNRWYIDGIAVCGTGTDDEAGYIGGNTGGTCAAGNEEFNFTLVHTTARSNPGAGNPDVYYDYPAETDVATTCAVVGAGANLANCDNEEASVVDVASYTGSASPLGTYDQGGNVWEWNEALTGANRYIRGGSFTVAAGNLAAAIRSNIAATSEGDIWGFRVAAAIGADPYTTWAVIGDPGNDDDGTGYGGVADAFLMAAYETTNTEYTAFLNAIAETDTNSLYVAGMGSGHGGIDRSGSPGSYTYAVAAGEGDRPVNWVSFWSAARYANWLHNDQPNGAQDATTTEGGAYTLTVGCIAANSCTRNPSAMVFLPTEDEWYKAAYYSPGDDNYLDANISVIETDFLAVFRTGMEAGHAYPITIIDHAADIFNLVLDVRQQPHGYTNDHAGFPLADRAIVSGSVVIGYAPEVGDTCIESSTSLISADGEYVGACWRGCDASGANCDACSRRISASFDEEHCDGTASAGHDAFHFERPLEKAYAGQADFTIEPLCVCTSDELDILAPSRIVCDDSRDDGECKAIFRGAVTLAGFEFGGVGKVVYDGATATLSDVHSRGCGTTGEACTQFIDMNDVRMVNSSVVGGPETGDSGAYSFSGISGLTYVNGARARYYTDTAWKSLGSAMGSAAIYNPTCERIGRAEGGTVFCFSVAVSTWSMARLYDLFTTDPVLGNTADILTSAGPPLVVNGLGVFGLPGTTTGGGISRQTGGTNVVLSNAYIRRMNTGRGATASNTAWGSHLSHSDIRDSLFDVGGAAGLNGVGLGVVVRENIIADSTTNSTMIINASDAAGNVDISGNVFANLTTSNAGDTWGVKVTTDNDPTSTVKITRNSWLHSDDETTAFDKAFGSVDTDTDDSLEFWGNLVYGHVSAEVGGEIISMDFPADMIAFMTMREGTNNCVGYGAATGGGGATYEAVSNAGSYPIAPLIGGVPAIVDEGEGRYVLKQGSRYAALRCGAKTGTYAPGMQTGHAALFERMGLPEPRRFMVDHGRRGR